MFQVPLPNKVNLMHMQPAGGSDKVWRMGPMMLDKSIGPLLWLSASP